jgi:hypothetical protein
VASRRQNISASIQVLRRLNRFGTASIRRHKICYTAHAPLLPLLNISSQFASNRMFQRRTEFMSFSVFPSSRSLPKMESTNSVPAFLPMETPLLPSLFAAFHMNLSHSFNSSLNFCHKRFPLSMKSSTISLSMLRMRPTHSSARFIFPASLIKSSHVGHWC